MHTLCVLSTLFLRPFPIVTATVLPPSDFNTPISSNITNITSKFPTWLNSHPSPTSLTFDIFGSQIPSSAVNAAFSGAVTRIYPFLQNQADNPISNDDFQYRAVGGSVQIGVTASRRHGISWRQLDAVLRQVSSFMNGDPGEQRPHMQELSFEIIKEATRVGEGLISYRPPRGFGASKPILATLKEAYDTQFLLALTNSSLNASTMSAIHFRIPNTPFKLIFGFFGDRIPLSDVWAAFEGAHSDIIGPLGQHPDWPIPGQRFEHREDNVRITVLVKSGMNMTWKQLSWVLGGLYGFMTGNPEHYELLTCEISHIGHAIVGYASVWWYPRPQVSKRTSFNTLALVPNPTEQIPFPVPDTPIIITFTYVGRAIPWRELDDAISAALDQINPSYRAHGMHPVPSNHFFRALNGVRISIFANVPHLMSWFQLHSIVWGLLLFVIGDEEGREHHRVLNFDVDDIRAGKLAYGSVRYTVPETVGFQ